MLASRHNATPKECANVAEIALLNLGNLAARLLFETEHCPHCLPTGVMLAVDYNLNLCHNSLGLDRLHTTFTAALIFAAGVDVRLAIVLQIDSVSGIVLGRAGLLD